MAKSLKIKRQNKPNNIINQTTVYMSVARYCHFLLLHFSIHFLIMTITEKCSNMKKTYLKIGRIHPSLLKYLRLFQYAFQYLQHPQYNFLHLIIVTIINIVKAITKIAKIPIPIPRSNLSQIVIAQLYHSVGG